MIRFHTQTGGVTLQAQQPEVNIIRVALQGFAAVSGGTQSLHTNGFDEALALPTERSARIALRTQQVLAHESGAADTVDPFAGSYFVESLTDEIEERAWELIEKVEELGGSVNALDFIQREIEESAASYHERYRRARTSSSASTSTSPTGRRRRHPQGRPRVRAAPAGAAGEVQGGPRPGRRRAPARGAARRRPRRRQPAPPDPRGARAPTPRSARSATRCATSSASTRAARSSIRQPRHRPATPAGASGRHLRAPCSGGSRRVEARRPNPAHMESNGEADAWSSRRPSSGSSPTIPIADGRRWMGGPGRRRSRADRGRGRPTASRSGVLAWRAARTPVLTRAGSTFRAPPRAASAPRSTDHRPATRAETRREAISAIEGVCSMSSRIPKRRPFAGGLATAVEHADLDLAGCSASRGAAADRGPRAPSCPAAAAHADGDGFRMPLPTAVELGLERSRAEAGRARWRGSTSVGLIYVPARSLVEAARPSWTAELRPAFDQPLRAGATGWHWAPGVPRVTPCAVDAASRAERFDGRGVPERRSRARRSRLEAARSIRAACAFQTALAARSGGATRVAWSDSVADPPGAEASSTRGSAPALDHDASSRRPRVARAARTGSAAPSSTARSSGGHRLRAPMREKNPETHEEKLAYLRELRDRRSIRRSDEASPRPTTRSSPAPRAARAGDPLGPEAARSSTRRAS